VHFIVPLPLIVSDDGMKMNIAEKAKLHPTTLSDMLLDLGHDHVTPSSSIVTAYWLFVMIT
jgi:hypothetical protein